MANDGNFAAKIRNQLAGALKSGILNGFGISWTISITSYALYQVFAAGDINQINSFLIGIGGGLIGDTLRDWATSRHQPSQSAIQDLLSQALGGEQVRHGLLAALDERIGLLETMMLYLDELDEEQRAELWTTREFEFQLLLFGANLPQKDFRLRQAPLEKPKRRVPFTNRVDELRSVLSELQPGVVFTICGPGGIGKSALMAEVVAALAPGQQLPQQFPDGIICYDFHQENDVNSALSHIAYSFGAAPLPTAQDAARRVLAGKQALLVLDGVEDTKGISAITGVATTCGVLIASRRRLDAQGEFLFVQPLSDTESLKLLDAWAGRQLNDELGATELAQQLGGLPLAILLVGHYLSRTSQYASEFAAWLEEVGIEALHFQDDPDKSIPVLMERSLAKVKAEARRVFAVAGVLAYHPFSLNAIEAALDLKRGKAAQLLAELIDFGLLVRPDEQYQVSHVLAHRYAQTLPLSGPEIGRLAQYYINSLGRMRQEGCDGFSLFRDVHPHIVSVQSAALSAGLGREVRALAAQVNEYLDLQGYAIDRVRINTAAITAAMSDLDVCEEAKYRVALANAHYALGSMQEASDEFERALSVLISDNVERADAYGGLGRIALYNEDVATAVEHFTRQLEIAHGINDQKAIAAAYGNLGTAILGYEDLEAREEAIQYFNRQLDSARGCSSRREEGLALGNLGKAYMLIDQPGQMGHAFQAQLKVMQEIGDKAGQSSAHENIGLSNVEFRFYDEAVAEYEMALDIARSIGDRRGEASICWNLGKVHELYGTKDRLLKAAEYMSVTVAYRNWLNHPRAENEAQYLQQLVARAHALDFIPAPDLHASSVSAIGKPIRLP